MRIWVATALLATACDRSVSRAERPAAITGIHVEESTGAGSTGEEARLDLGTFEPLSTSGESTSTGDDAPTSTDGEDAMGTSTSGLAETSTGIDTSGSTGGEENSSGASTGEPAPTCGDGTCDPAEHEGGCYQGPGWCFQDCWQAPACVSDCPCTPGAAAVKNFCNADPPVVCSATAPGGICDPDGDGGPVDADGAAGFYSWTATCG